MGSLRNMICNSESESVKKLMALMETQNEKTLGKWNLDMIRYVYMPILRKYQLDMDWVELGLEKGEAYLAKAISQKQWRTYFREIDKKHDGVKQQPSLALIRATIQAFRSLDTPTAGLGQLFYGAAALAYDELGIYETKEIYDVYGERFILKNLMELEKISIADEKNPVKINWYC